MISSNSYFQVFYILKKTPGSDYLSINLGNKNIGEGKNEVIVYEVLVIT